MSSLWGTDQLSKEFFEIFSSALGLPAEELESLRIGNHGTFALALTDKWCLSVDICGNVTMRPVSNLPHIAKSSGKECDIDNLDSEALLLKQSAIAILQSLGCRGVEKLTKSVVKKELLLTSECGSYNVRAFEGRYLVRFDGEDKKYFQVIFDSNGAPIRIDMTLASDMTDEFSRLLWKEIETSASIGTALKEGFGPISVGNFFDPTEHRFPVNADSYEGQMFLDPRIPGNSFPRDNFDVSNTNFLDVSAYRRSSDYKMWACTWWQIAGRVGCARGNWDSVTGVWQKPEVTVLQHSFDEYLLVGESPTETKDFMLSDGRRYMVPFAISRCLEWKFAEDLEKCTVAIFHTHAGPIEDSLQLRRTLDVWFRLGESDPGGMGSGALRHVFFNCCSTMGCYREYYEGNAKYQTLFAEWLSARYVKGLRTVCGIDGERVGLERDGWFYYQYYNQGSSISDSWLLSQLRDGCLEHAPVTCAYGASLDEATATLVDGRFCPDPVVPKWAVASVWRTVEML